MQGSQSVVRCINLLAHQHYYRMAEVKLVIQSSHLFGLISLASIRKKGENYRSLLSSGAIHYNERRSLTKVCLTKEQLLTCRHKEVSEPALVSSENYPLHPSDSLTSSLLEGFTSDKAHSVLAVDLS